jgi:hypothetical protein
VREFSGSAGAPNSRCENKHTPHFLNALPPVPDAPAQPAAKGSGRAAAAAAISPLDAVEALGRKDTDLAALVQRLTPSGGAGGGGGGAKRARGGGDPGGGGGRKALPDYWALQSVVEAVDLVLWSFVDQPGGARGGGVGPGLEAQQQGRGPRGAVGAADRPPAAPADTDAAPPRSPVNRKTRAGSALDARISALFSAHLTSLARLLKSQVSAHHLRTRVAELQNLYMPEIMAQLPGA